MKRFILKRPLNLGPKIPHLDIFGLQFNENYYQIFNQYCQICETIKFHPKQNKKNNKLRIENALLGLWAGMLKNYCHICNQHPPLSNRKVLCKNLEPKLPYLDVLENLFKKLFPFL